MAVAWIGFIGGLLAALLSTAVAVRQSRMDERLVLLNRRLDAEAKAEEVLTRYRQPLAAAAFDLQSRLYNLLRLDFLEKFGGEHPRGEEALRTTLFRIAQYFGWSEILRRDVQFLNFPEAGDSRHVAQLQSAIARQFLTDGHGPALMIWTDEQRAIGERMIVEEHGKVICMGYATFGEHCATTFGPWRERLASELPEAAARERLREVQHLLCELVELLDAGRVRYADADLQRA